MRNAEAFEEFLVDLDTTDVCTKPLVTAGRTLSREVDLSPDNASLWGQYLRVVRMLTEAQGNRRETMDEALDKLFEGSA